MFRPKIKCYNETQNKPHVEPKEAYQSRYMPLTCYQLLKVYSKLLESKQSDIKKIDLQHVMNVLSSELNTFIKNDPYSWNIISEVESILYGDEDEESAGNSSSTMGKSSSQLDLFLKKHQECLNTSRYQATWKTAYVRLFEELNNGRPARPKKGLGSLKLVQVNSQGEGIDTRDIPYCILGRFFNLQQKSEVTLSPILEVVLPSPWLKDHLLNSFRYYKTNKDQETVPYRIDLFGGNHMKAASRKVEDLLAGRTTDDYGRLIAMPVSELNEKSTFTELIAKLFPSKESFFYFQRALLAQPKLLKKSELDDKDDKDDKEKGVLEGKFSIQLFKNYAPLDKHPFQLKSDIALRPYDGCGFIKESLAKDMGIALKTRDSADNRLDLTQKDPNYLPAQALQHYTIDDQDDDREAVKEITSKLKNHIKSINDPSPYNIFCWLTSSGIRGRSLLALPASDGKVHYPYQNKDNTSILIGRTPYDQPNLYPIEKNQLCLSSPDVPDPTTDFLTRDGKVVQYSLIAQSQDESKNKLKMLWFAKGLLVVIPDDVWPENYNKVDIALSSADIKTHTGWTSSEEKNKFQKEADRRVEVAAILTAIDLFPYSKSIALPIDVQTYLSGDFDGDQVLVIDDYKQLYKAIQNKKKKYEQIYNRTLKPSKNITSAFSGENNTYVFSRSEQISATKKQVLEQYATLQSLFLALSSDKRKEVSKKVKNKLEKLDDQKEDKQSEAVLWLTNFLSSGIKAGTDAYKAGLDITKFAKAAPYLQSIFSRYKVQVPYNKSSLTKRIFNKDLQIDALQDALKDNTNYAAICMKQSIELLNQESKLEAYTSR